MPKIRALPVLGATVLVLSALTASVPSAANAAATIATWAPGVPAPAPPAAMNGANLAPTPPMGWNDWAHYGCTTANPYAQDVGPSASLYSTVAGNLVNSGLAADGYNTVTVDDCWMQPTRDANGNLQIDTTKFPSQGTVNGMQALGNLLHADNLKFGIYNDAGSATCTGQAGSGSYNAITPNHYAQDADQFASFGVDYVKMDGCNVSSSPPSLSVYEGDYAAMSQAIANSGRPMAFSESEPAYFYIGQSNVSDWYNSLASSQGTGQLWREGNDAPMWFPTYSSGWGWSGYVQTNFNYDWPLARYSGPNSWNDPDFLLTGDNTLTVDQQKSQFALWSMVAAPLIVSSAAGNLDSTNPANATTLSILGDKGIIAVDQDRLGAAATVVSSTGTDTNGTEVLARPLANGDRALALFNDTGNPQVLSTTLAQAGYNTAPGCSYTVTDLWTGATTTANAGTPISASLAADGTEIYRVSSPYGCGTTTPATPVTGPINSQAGCVSVNTATPPAAVPAPCTGSAAQRFALNGDGTVRNGASCLTATGTSTQQGAPVQFAACTKGASTQQWGYTSTGNLTDAYNNLCLDVYGGVQGTWLDTWPCGNAQANQTFQLPVSQATGELHVLTTSAGNGTCLATQNGGLTAGTPVVSAPCDGSTDQNWTEPGDGTIRLGALCLDDTASGGAGTQQELWTCTGNANQAWSYNELGYLANNTNQLCLGVPGDNTAAGTPVETETCSNTGTSPANDPGQLWTIPQ